MRARMDPLVGAVILAAGVSVVPGVAAGSAEGVAGGDGRDVTEAVGAVAAAVPDTVVPTPDGIARLFGPDGDRAEGMEALARYAVTLPPARATLWIQLLAAVERTEPGLAPALVDAVREGEAGNGIRAAEALEEAAGSAAADQRAPLLWIAALVAEGPAPEKAARIRARLLDEHPEAFEAPEAALRQARRLAAEGDRDGARGLLEDLVVARPDHPVVPEARRLLDLWRRP